MRNRFLSSLMLLVGFSAVAHATDAAKEGDHHRPNVIMIECTFDDSDRDFDVSSVTPSHFNQVREGDDCALALSKVTTTGYQIKFNETQTDYSHKERTDYLVYTLIKDHK
jgi:hypothetical protein